MDLILENQEENESLHFHSKYITIIWLGFHSSKICTVIIIMETLIILKLTFKVIDNSLCIMPFSIQNEQLES